MNDLRHEFEELSLGGFTDSKGRRWEYAIQANGVAHIEFDADGDWRVSRIEIETHARGEVAGWDCSFADLDPSEMLFRTIAEALKSTHSDAIADDIREALAEERGCEAESRAEYRRAS